MFQKPDSATASSSNPKEEVMRNLLLAAGATFALFLSAAAAEEAPNKAVGVEATPLLKANQTLVGGPLKYPATDKPEIGSAIVTIQPGGRTSLHQHPVVTVLYVLDGQIAVHIGEKILDYKAGEALIEPIDVLNQVFNPGSAPTKVLVVQVGEEGKPNSISAK
jgi:quercetin dioxygenase-like cupin family protein